MLFRSLKEDLYKLFLDKDMQYSCAYFHNENISLDQAQMDKKKHIINKLQIEENMNVLDIGCGWGECPYCDCKIIHRDFEAKLTE